MFNIIIKEMKEFLRDKSNLFFYLLFPAMMVFLLGNLLNSMDEAEATVGRIKIQYIVATENPYQLSAIQSFAQTASDKSSISFERADDLNTAKNLAGRDEITAAVIFSGDPLKIQIYEGSDRIQNRAVTALINSFVQNDKTVTAVVQKSPEALNNLKFSQENNIKQKDLGINRSMLDYYAVSMAAMISFMSMLSGASAFMDERRNKTINRWIIAPQNRVSMFFQKIIGIVPQVALQIAVIMLISVIVFKAHYAVTFTANLYLFFMFLVVTVCMVALGAVIGMLVKVNPTAVIMPVLWIMMFLGGTFSKNVNIKGVTDAMPIYRIQQSAFDLAVFGRFGKANHVILGCGLILAVALAAGAILFYRKEEER